MKTQKNILEDYQKVGHIFPAVFGGNLVQITLLSMYDDGIKLPKIVRDCITRLDEEISTEGIYRISGQTNKVEQLKKQYNSYSDVDLSGVDIHTIASLFKLYLREFSENILTIRLKPHFDNLAQNFTLTEQDKVYVPHMKHILKFLPSANYDLLSYLCTHLFHVIEDESNKMTFENIVTCFVPTLEINKVLLHFLIKFHAKIFKSPKFVKPLTSFVSPNVLDDTVEKLSQEILRLSKRTENGKNEKLTTKLYDMQVEFASLKRRAHSINSFSGIADDMEYIEFEEDTHVIQPDIYLNHDSAEIQESRNSGYVNHLERELKDDQSDMDASSSVSADQKSHNRAAKKPGIPAFSYGACNNDILKLPKRKPQTVEEEKRSETYNVLKPHLSHNQINSFSQSQPQSVDQKCETSPLATQGNQQDPDRLNKPKASPPGIPQHVSEHRKSANAPPLPIKGEENEKSTDQVSSADTAKIKKINMVLRHEMKMIEKIRKNNEMVNSSLLQLKKFLRLELDKFDQLTNRMNEYFTFTEDQLKQTIQLNQNILTTDVFEFLENTPGINPEVTVIVDKNRMLKNKCDEDSIEYLRTLLELIENSYLVKYINFNTE